MYSLQVGLAKSYTKYSLQMVSLFQTQLDLMTQSREKFSLKLGIHLIGFSFSGGSRYIGVGGELPPTPPADNLAPPGRKFQTIHESLLSLSCKHIFFINVRNSLFRVMILFEVLDELQLIDQISKLDAPSKFSAPPPSHATKPKSTTVFFISTIFQKKL